MRRWAATLLLAGCLCAGVAVGAASTPATIEAGESIYRHGLGADGRPISAIVQGDVPMADTAVACVNCHRRSGLGSSEGSSRALPVTAAALFGGAANHGATLVSTQRPDYTDRTLRRAIVEGIASDGRALSPLMPRYALNEVDLQTLTAYLRTLGGTPSTGVDATTVRLVSIIADSAPAAEQEAVSRVLTRFAAIKNSGTRRESQRAAASRRQPYGERHVRGYRQWDLKIWRLHGPASSWPQQLKDLYDDAPPFAVLSGSVGDDWSIVHDFCERQALPCILPIAAVPGDASQSRYVIYYSAGVALEARVSARDILATQSAAGHVLLVHPDNARGRAGRGAFQEAWRPTDANRLSYRAVSEDSMPTAADWRTWLESAQADVVVAWLGQRQLQGLEMALSTAKTKSPIVYTAQSFTDWSIAELPDSFAAIVRHVYPYRLSANGLLAFPREQVWLKNQHLQDLQVLPAAEALFACHAVGEAMAGMVGNYSQDYLIETLEHMLDGSNMTTIFPHTTLGSGQRTLAKGAYVLRPRPGSLDTDASPRWVGW